jgi:hypothetical protein
MVQLKLIRFFINYRCGREWLLVSFCSYSLSMLLNVLFIIFINIHYQAHIQHLMENFDYGYFDSRDQPPPIQIRSLQNGRISATATQKLCLFKLFPIMFSNFINQMPSFTVYIQLREILDLVLSIPFRRQWLPVLYDLSVAFQQSMIIHFPHQLIPKLHFITEYSQMIDDYGPAIKQWSMRYEACHAYYKKITLRSNNYKNISKMLASRYQLRNIFKYSRMNYELRNFDQVIKVQKVENNIFNNSMKQILVSHFGNINFSQDLMQCSRFYHDNKEYNRSCVYIVDLIESTEIPKFAQILYILKKSNKWWLLLDELQTMCYDEKICAWEIRSTNHFSMVDPNNLKYYYKGLDIYHINNSSFVTYTSRLTIH